MKLIIRSVIAALFLIALALQALAQNPNVAVRISPPSSTGSCFLATVRNLRNAPIGLTGAYIGIFDQSKCKMTCESKIPLGNKLGPCQVFRFKICCEKPLPPKFIAYVRVNHALGNNEGWFFQP